MSFSHTLDEDGGGGVRTTRQAVAPRLDPPRRRFGQRVSSARETAGLSRAELGELVGIFPEDVETIEVGRLLPSPPLALAISSAVGCPSLLRAYLRERSWGPSTRSQEDEA